MARYARLLGASWLQLAEPVRSVHATPPTMHARGRLRIEHGRSHLARFLARLLRLPRASEAAETPTRQYQAAAGELAERFGVLEFRFRLEVSEGSLLFRQ